MEYFVYYNLYSHNQVSLEKRFSDLNELDS